MRASDQRKSREILKRKGGINLLLIGVLLFGYISFLLVTNYLSQVELKEIAFQRLSQDINKRSAVLAYYFSERQSDMKNLLASGVISTYFENKALGMSLAYGLRTSQFNISKHFVSFIESRTINSDAIYHRILFVDRNGKKLADTKTEQLTTENDKTWDVFLDFRQQNPHIQVTDSLITISAPYFFKGKHAGQIIADIIPKSFYDHLVHVKHLKKESHHVGVVVGKRIFYLPEGMSPDVVNDGLTELAQVEDGQYRSFDFAEEEEGGKVTKMVIMRSPVTGTPLSLVIFRPVAEVAGDRSPKHLLMTLAVFAMMFGGGFFFIWRANAQRANMQRQMIRIELQEAAKRQKLTEEKNRALNQEIIERKSIAEELAKANKVAETASRAKSEFLAIMSHELRTPLNHMIGFTDLVVDGGMGEVNEDQKKYLNIALDSSKSLLNLIDDILEFTSAETGKIQLDISRVKLPTLLGNTLLMLEKEIQKHHIRVETDLTDLPSEIDADEGKLQQVLYNLISNAIKFTPDEGLVSIAGTRLSIANGLLESADGRKIPISKTADDTVAESKEYVKITISDTGIGLQPDDLQRVFLPFDQVDSSSNRQFEGIGIGLALTQKYIERHGGAIWAESAGEGKGSTFCVVLDIERQGDGGITSPAPD